MTVAFADLLRVLVLGLVKGNAKGKLLSLGGSAPIRDRQAAWRLLPKVRRATLLATLQYYFNSERPFLRNQLSQSLPSQWAHFLVHCSFSGFHFRLSADPKSVRVLPASHWPRSRAGNHRAATLDHAPSFSRTLGSFLTLPERLTGFGYPRSRPGWRCMPL